MASSIGESGFRSELIGNALFQIWEPSGVSCFLVIGSERALLVDTGYGLWNLHGFLETLTNLPIIVVNSHGHIDHSGGNYQFESAYLHPADHDLARRHASDAERRRVLDFIKISRPEYPAQGMCSLRSLPSDRRFDLGDRTVEAVPCPGHTAGSMAFFDETTGIALVGDALSRHVWLFDEDSTSVSDLLQSIHRLRAFPLKALFCSHSPERLRPQFLEYFARFAARIRVDESEPFPIPLAATEALIYHEGGKLFESGDFLSIVYKPEKLR